jgi:hypothetical protein
MGEHLRTELSTTGLIEASSYDGMDDLVAELEGDNDQRLEREQTIQRLINNYGGQLFKYGSRSGTVGDIIDLCPAADVVLEQGFDAMVGWIDGYKVDFLEEVTKEEEQKEEILQAEDTSAQKQQEETVNDSRKEAKKETVVVPVEKKIVETEPFQQSSGMEGSSSDISVSSEVKAIPSPPEKSVVTTDVDRKVQEPIITAREAIEAAYASESTIETPKSSVSPDIVTLSQDIVKLPVEKTEEAVEPTAETISLLAADSPSGVDELPIREPVPVEIKTPLEMPEEFVLEMDVAGRKEPDSSNEQEAAIGIEDDSDTFALPNIEDDPNLETQFGTELLADEERTSDHDPIADTDTADSQEADSDLFAHIFTEIPEQSIIESRGADENDLLALPVVQSDLELAPIEGGRTEVEISEVLEGLTGGLVIEALSYDPVENEQRIAKTLKSVTELQAATSTEECAEALADLRIALRDLLYGLGYDNSDEIVSRAIRQYDMVTLRAILIRLQALMCHDAAVKQSTINHKKHHAIGYHAVRLLVFW